ncbi:MAG: DUF4982 domain-containing protein [Cyclobacteriaceae bacterium]|nr:DUF4982 domain-containing protein [Cyclobacteriaceae bacterium]UYN85471.1 MAG: DUF4982 domain-containing protein [Cyclobacteriaceae bacterium]
MRAICILIFTLFTFAVSSQNGRFVSSINSSWEFHRGEVANAHSTDPLTDAWKVINLPHSWNDKDVTADGERGYYRGPGWYRKSVFISGDNSKKYFLHFEGANQKTTVYVNGQKVGEHVGGYSAFTFEITSVIKRNSYNLIEVKVDNSHNSLIPPLSADFTFFGGIYRDVFLVETDHTHFAMDDFGSSGIFITTPVVTENTGLVQVKGTFMYAPEKSKNLRIRSTITTKEGREISRFEQKLNAKAGKNSFSIKSPLLTSIEPWSPQKPNLYYLTVQLVDDGKVRDELTQPLGFRSFSFDPVNGFFLNGKPLKLIGANRHQDMYGAGNALSDERHRADLQLLKDMGANFIRLAHYPQDPAVLRAADELGILVWEETPLVNEITLDECHHKNSEVMLLEMIRQHYNHPSVILWGYMNEIYWAHRFLPQEKVEAHTKETVRLAKTLEKIAREEDPTRYTAMAMHNYPLYEESGIDSIPQVAGWNLYHGWYYDELEDFGKFMDRQHAKYPNRPHIISEYGAGADNRLHSLQSEKFDFSAEFQKRFHESFLKQILERPFIAGAAVWNLIDFSSERRIDATPHLNNKGLATYDRTPKDAYYLYQAALRKDPILKIAERGWTHRTDYPPAANETAGQYPIQVYTNLAEVELLLNGQSLGKKKAEDYQVTFDVTLLPGQNTIEVRGENHAMDFVTISFQPLPWNLKEGFTVLAVNAGSNCDYTEEISGQIWVKDKSYSKGSWGYLEGKPLYVANKIGSKEDILTIDDDPLYQTMRVGSRGYRFDVSPGRYEVELLFTDPYPVSRRFVDGAESPDHPGDLRVFDVLINNRLVLPSLDLLKHQGYNYPLREKFIIQVLDENGLSVTFQSQKGETIISGIKLTYLGR